MAKSKPNDKAKKQARKEAKKMATSNESPEQLYAAALTFIEQQQPAEAFQQAQKLYEIVQISFPFVSFLSICACASRIFSQGNTFSTNTLKVPSLNFGSACSTS